MAVNVVCDIDNLVAIKHVLVSVSDKTGLDTFIPALIETCPDVVIYSTGGTYTAIKDMLKDKTAAHLVQVSDYTGQPETQGGLVKTLDFKIYLGILTEKYNPAHQADLARTSAVAIDMVVCNLYPFAKTVAKEGVTVEEARSNIDIGGPTMVRASAKNYLRVASVVNPEDYPVIIEKLKAAGGKLDLKSRYELSCKAFAHTAEYDSAIAKFLGAYPLEKVPTTYNLMHK